MEIILFVRASHVLSRTVSFSICSSLSSMMTIFGLEVVIMISKGMIHFRVSEALRPG